MKRIDNLEELSRYTNPPGIYGNDATGDYYQGVTVKRDANIPLLSKLFVCSVVVLVLFALARLIWL